MKEKKVRQIINDKDVAIVQKSKKSLYGKVIYYILGFVISLTFLFPFFYMIACSTKTNDLIDHQSGTLMIFVPDFANLGHMFDNYKQLFTGDYNIGRYALNSLFYAAISIILNILINGLAAYAICKLRFPGKKFFNFIIMFLIIVPVETSIIPLLVICKQLLHLQGNWSILAIIFPASISIFNIFLFIQFFSSIPKEFEEAARMDGANTIQVFFKVILPLSKPILATVAVFCFIGVWNDYLWPTMIMTDKTMWPIQAALSTIKETSKTAENSTGIVMSSLVLTTIPIFVIYVAAQKYIVKGFGAGGLKL